MFDNKIYVYARIYFLFHFYCHISMKYYMFIKQTFFKLTRSSFQQKQILTLFEPNNKCSNKLNLTG